MDQPAIGGAHLSAVVLMKLSREFFQQPTCTVAEALLGKVLCVHGKRIILTETEAYHGFDDPASHAYRGKTPRTSIMFGPAGFTYVYLIYGMYHCLNIVTEQEGYPAAVLIRGGICEETQQRINGPGKLCRYLSLDRRHNALDVTAHPDIYLEDRNLSFPATATPRIGIKQGLDKAWRFVAKKQSSFLL